MLHSQNYLRSTLSALACFFAAAVTPAHAATEIVVTNTAELMQAVSSANSSGGDTEIVLEDGVYTLTDTIYINSPDVMLRSSSGIRENVVVQGDAMAANAQVGNLIRVAASRFELHGITLQKSGNHLVQVAGETNADDARFSNCVFRDAYEQMLKVSVDLGNPSVTGDNGSVSNCLFEYSAGVGPQYYIGGIDAHGAKSWIVSDNEFRSIASPSNSVAEFAIHFWNGSADNLVERNLIVDCDRGIGFGLDNRGNSGGLIRNNIIYSSANTGQFADTGIALVESPNTRVINNTVFIEHSFPWAIEYRFAASQNIDIENNLTNKAIQSRDGGSATVRNNIVNGESNWFVNTGAGDLHLASGNLPPIDAGAARSDLTDDFDGQSRPTLGSVDIGADEFGGSTVTTPNPPTNLRAQ